MFDIGPNQILPDRIEDHAEDRTAEASDGDHHAEEREPVREVPGAVDRVDEEALLALGPAGRR